MPMNTSYCGEHVNMCIQECSLMITQCRSRLRPSDRETTLSQGQIRQQQKEKDALVENHTQPTLKNAPL